MKNHRLDGINVSKSALTSDYDGFKQLKNLNIPVVFFDNSPVLEELCYSTGTLESEMLQAIECLVNEGHRYIAFINGPAELQSSKERLEAFKKGIDKHNINIGAELTVSSDLSSIQNNLAMLRLLTIETNKPTAIIAFDDRIVQDAIASRGKYNLNTYPGIRLISFVNSIEVAWADYQTTQSDERY